MGRAEMGGVCLPSQLERRAAIKAYEKYFPKSSKNRKMRPENSKQIFPQKIKINHDFYHNFGRDGRCSERGRPGTHQAGLIFPS
jgi:hypothetical protein